MPPQSVAVVPAYEAQRSVGQVARELREAWQRLDPTAPVVVVDDGSSDDTAGEAERAGAVVLRHQRNRGKGAALRTGLEHAWSLGAALAISVDADGQHFARDAVALARHPAPADALVLGVRDMRASGAPRANQRSNAISNFFISLFSGRELSDTQCGLRRYPLPATLELGLRDEGYAFETEVILRAARAGWTIAQQPVNVYYPPEQERVTHFHVVRDPARIVARVLHTLATTRRRP